MFICKVSLAVRCHGQRTDSFGICVLTLFLASLCLLFIVSTIRQKGIFKNICVEKFSLVVLCVVNLCYSLCYILFLNPLDFAIALHILACFCYRRALCWSGLNLLHIDACDDERVPSRVPILRRRTNTILHSSRGGQCSGFAFKKLWKGTIFMLSLGNCTDGLFLLGGTAYFAYSRLSAHVSMHVCRSLSREGTGGVIRRF